MAPLEKVFATLKKKPCLAAKETIIDPIIKSYGLFLEWLYQLKSLKNRPDDPTHQEILERIQDLAKSGDHNLRPPGENSLECTRLSSEP